MKLELNYAIAIILITNISDRDSGGNGQLSDIQPLFEQGGNNCWELYSSFLFSITAIL